jgi:hypothetical protein
VSVRREMETWRNRSNLATGRHTFLVSSEIAAFHSCQFKCSCDAGWIVALPSTCSGSRAICSAGATILMKMPAFRCLHRVLAKRPDGRDLGVRERASPCNFAGIQRYTTDFCIRGFTWLRTTILILSETLRAHFNKSIINERMRSIGHSSSFAGTKAFF